MCGIVGYIGTRRAVPIILEGLRRLEYRGYDSAGLAVYCDDGQLAVRPRLPEPEPGPMGAPEPVPMLEPEPALMAEMGPPLDLDDLETPAYLRQGRLLN